MIIRAANVLINGRVSIYALAFVENIRKFLNVLPVTVVGL